MNRLIMFVGLITFFGTQMVQAQSVTPSVTTRALTTVETDGGAPLGGTVYQFFLDSTADILSIGNVDVTLTSGNIYQHAGGTDAAPPTPFVLSIAPAAAADSYITTPGSATTMLGTTITATSWTALGGGWTDVSNDGAQSGFQFAQFTLDPGAVGSYTFDLTYAGQTAPETLVFSGLFPIPEPASLAMLGLGGLLMLQKRRRRA